jgi:hypothetical protein
MSLSSPDDPGGETDTTLPPMALLATLQTAWTVKGAIGERRAGRDPAAQQSADDARAYLAEAARELTRLHMQLLMAKVQAARPLPSASSQSDGLPPDGLPPDGKPGDENPEPPARGRRVAMVRQFDVLMKLRRTGRLLHSAHQRLMSLYPAVSEELVEEARRCRGELSTLDAVDDASGEDRFGEPLTLFLQRLLSFAAWLEREL